MSRVRCHPGRIPTSLGNLTALLVLRLGTNHLSGPIPDSIGNLADLTVLWLASNQLSGQLPIGLRELMSLRTMQLASNPSLNGALCDANTMIVFDHHNITKH